MDSEHTYYLANSRKVIGPRQDKTYILYALYMRNLPPYFPNLSSKPFQEDGASYHRKEDGSEYYVVVTNRGIVKRFDHDFREIINS